MKRISAKQFQRAATALTVLAGLATSNVTYAATVNASAGVRTTCASAGNGNDQDSGPNNAGASINDGRESCASALAARAGAGFVGVRGNLSSIGAPGTRAYEMSANAASFMNGIRVTPGAGRTEAELVAIHGRYIDISVNANLNGTLTGIVSPGDTQFSRVAGVLLGGSVELISTVGRDTRSASANYGFNTTRDPKVSGTNFLGANLRPTVYGEWQREISVTFRLGGSGNIGGYDNTDAFADFNAFNSLSFSTDGPAFILPDGFTVHAPELNIFDNQWIDPRADPSPVPLPAGLPLLLGALACIGMARRFS